MSGPGDQLHDFEPGIAPSGLFWTIPIDGGAVDASPGRGRARYRLEDFALNDFHDFFTAISPSPPDVPSHVSFEVTWSGGNDHQRVADTTFDFTGTFVTSDATDRLHRVERRHGRGLHLKPGRPDYDGAGVGHERNGVFF